jgi:hypothetical protein
MNASEKIDELIATTDDWRAATFAAAREAVLAADPDIVEGWKYMGSPVWDIDGSTFVTGNIFKSKIKIGFMHGALIDDPDKLFNGELGGNQRRSYELSEGDEVDKAGLTKLVKAAIARKRSK